MSVETPDDRRLFEALASGGSAAEAALRQIYDRYAKRLFGLLRSKGFVAEEAEEILQEAFLKLFRNADRADSIEAPKAYIYRTVINCGNDLLRKKQRAADETNVDEKTLESYLHNEGASADDANDGFVDCLAAAYARFERQSPERGLVIRLAVIEGMSGKEVAATIGRSHGAMREFLSQTRKKFQELLVELCGDYVPNGVVNA